MKTCFVCGRLGTRVDPDSGELMCAFHFDPSPAQLPIARAWVVDPWERLKQVAVWHAGSASEHAQAMARRLAKTLEERHG